MKKTIRHGVSLTVTLAVSIGTLTLLGVASILLYFVTVSRTTAVDSVLARSELIIGSIVEAIDGTIYPAVDVTDFISGMIEDGWLDLDETYAIEAALLGGLGPSVLLLAAGVETGDGRIVMADQLYFEGDDGMPVVEYGASSQSVADVAGLAPLVTLARERGGPAWGPIQFDEGYGESFLTYVRPVTTPSGEERYVFALVSVYELSALLADISDDYDTTAFVMSAERRMIAHGNLLDLMDQLSPAAPTLGIREVGDPELALLAGARPAPGIPRWRQSELTFELRFAPEDAEGRGRIFMVAELPGFSEEPWVVAAHFDANTVAGDLRRVANAQWIGIGILLFAILAAIVLARAIARPIRRLADGAMRVSNLDVSAISRLPMSRIRELNDQAQSFNAMLDALVWFERYVPRTLVSRLVRGVGEAGVVSEYRPVTVLFTDIVGFTRESENLSATDVAAFLNGHFAMIGAAIEAEDGTIDKFIGDAVMAFWGAPLEQPDHADRGVRAALAIARAIADDDEARAAAGLPPVRLRIGVHTGMAVVGNIGAPTRMNYTIVGDAVNVAQRLEGLGKDLSPDETVSLLLSADIVAALRDPLPVVSLGSHQLRGRVEPVEVFAPASQRGD